MTRTQYAGLDYATAQDDLLARLQAQFAEDFNDFAVSSLAVVLIDLQSYGLDGLAFYLDKRAGEAYLATARTRGAVARLTRQLGYKMRSAASASVDLQVSIPDTWAFTVPIPKGFLFEGPNDLTFEVAREVTFQAGETGGLATKVVPVFEGQAQSETFVSDGTANQAFALRRARDGKYVIAGTVTVAVNGTTWSESEMLTFEASNQFEVGYNDEPPMLRFGDGIAGNIPPSGATITATYRASSGAAGRVVKETITEPVTPLVVSFTTIPMTVSMPTGSSGGDDPESLDQARQGAPLTWKSRQVAVTRSDYEGLAASYADPLAGRVAVAQAFATRSADADLFLQEQVREIRAAAIAPVSPTAAAIADARVRLDDAVGDLVSMVTQTSGLLTSLSTVQTEVGAIQTVARQVETSAANLATTAGSVTAAAAAAKAALLGFTIVSPSTPEQIRQTTLDTFNGRLDTITASAALLAAAGGTMGGQAASQLTSLSAVRDGLADIGHTVTPGTRLYALDQLRQAIAASLGVSVPASGVFLDLVAIEDAVVDAGNGIYAAIYAATEEIIGHLDQILAADCQANLVTVPILSRDASGFYTAPSTSLIQSLQAHLDARKEVTQVVKVVSGASYLVPAVLAIRVGVVSGGSLSLVQTAIAAAVDGILRGRKPRVSLYLSDFDGLKTIGGVAFVNVQIQGYLSGTTLLYDKLDGSGNLILGESELATKGSVTVTPEYAPAVS